MSTGKDVLLIGSGISSLTAALLLARRGHSVRVLEMHTKPGGYLHCFRRFGLRFETGAHYVGAMAPGEPFRVLLDYLGVWDPDHYVPLDPDGFDELIFPTFRVAMKTGYEATIDELSRAFPDEHRGIRRYFTAVAAAAKLFPTYEFCDAVDEAALGRALETPLAHVANREIGDPRARAAIYAYCALHGVAPEDVGFGFHALVTDSLLRGAYGFRHGGDALANKFVEQIRRHGGEVVTRAKVTELLVEGGEVKEAVTARGERYRADWVISSLHPKATFRLVRDAEKHFRPAFLSRVARLSESAGLLGVYAKCTDAPAIRPDRNYYFFETEDPARMLNGLVFAARAERTDARPVPLTLHAAARPGEFAQWRESAFGKRPDDYEAVKAARAKELIRFVARFDPGLESRVEEVAVSTPVTNHHFNGSEEGSAYGIYHSVANTGVRALGPRTHLKNLLLTGQSSLFPGLMGAAIAGLRTVGSLVGIRETLRELAELRERRRA